MVNCQQIKTDVLVIGGGAAGMMASLKAAEAGCSVMMVTDGAYASTGILGFNALVSEKDSRELFCEDVLRGGWYINDPSLVSAFVDGTVQAVKDLEALGLKFDKHPDGSYHLLQPLGCSVPRLVHCGNKTGIYAMETIGARLKELGEMVWEHTTACGLHEQGGNVTGAWVYRVLNQEPWKILAKAVVIATGGGHLLKGSTYPKYQTGDGYAMAYRAGAKLRDMEFFQHEPCRAVWPKPLGISTTLLAKGGKLTNALEERFVLKTHTCEGAASKDELARIIGTELKAGRGTPHGGVWLDLTDLPEEEIRVNHSLYDLRFRNEGIDLCKERVEVGPAAHSIMGGISVNTDCSTDVGGLFAAGEAMGGLHGANRLGGNAGSEVFVFGSIAGNSAAQYAKTICNWDSAEKELDWNIDENVPNTGEFDAIMDDIRGILSRAMGPIRDADSLNTAQKQLDEVDAKIDPDKCMNWEDRIACFKTQNLLLVGKQMLMAALARKESRGVHSREDFPERDDISWKRSILISK